MKNIVIVRDYLSRGGGGCTATLSLAQMLNNFHNLSLIFTYKDQVDEDLLLNQSTLYLCKKAPVNRYIRFFLLYTRELFKLYKLLSSKRPDYVVCFGTTVQTILTLCKFVLPFKLIVSERSDPGSLKSLSDRIRYKCYGYSDTIVFQTEGAMRYFNKKIQDKAVVIPNPITIPQEKWDMNKTTESVVSVGRFEVVQKRQDLLLKAFKIILESKPWVKLHFLGDGDDKQSMKDLAMQLGISDSVVFHGVVRNVKVELLKHRLFVLCSDYEGMPNALLEAMSLGMPVVSTNCRPGGASSLIDNQQNGLLTECGNSEQLANAILYILDNPKTSEMMADCARSSLSRFDPRIIGSLWLKIFE